MTKMFEFPDDHDVRIAQARRRAGWAIGHEEWADIILLAYMNPDADREILDAEMDELD